MPNHVIRDRIWESKKLERCSDGAAAWYPWIFLVCDDHGRFEYHPRSIWMCVFRRRPSVTQEDVEQWLQEYEAQGLLVRYHVEGELAFWTKFEGRKPSERRESTYQDPMTFPDVVAKLKALETGRGSAAPLPRKARDTGADEPRGERPRSDRIGDRDGSETEPSAAGAPAGDTLAANPIAPSREPWEREWLSLVGEISKLEDLDPTEVAGRFGEWTSREGFRSRKLRPDTMKLERLMNVVLDMRKHAAALRAKANPPAPPAVATNEQLEARQAAAAAARRDGLERGRQILQEAMDAKANGRGPAPAGAEAPGGDAGDGPAGRGSGGPHSGSRAPPGRAQEAEARPERRGA